MGLLDFIFGKPILMQSLFFGQMRFIKNKRKPSKTYFECKRYFKPKNDTIDICIIGNMEGPTQRQIDFFESIENNYSKISGSITTSIEKEFRNWKEDFKIIDFKKEFKPVYLSIPECEVAQPIIWEIAFETNHDKNHTFTLTMDGFITTAILIDG